MGRAFVCSDIHGNYKIWTKIKNFLNADDILYYLGDATDRGPDGWKILKEMLSHPNVIYIAGNHDIMLANRIQKPDNYHIATIHSANGGFLTWASAEKDPEAKRVMRKLFTLPLHTTYINEFNQKIFMSHSGSTDIYDNENLLWDREEIYKTINDTPYDIIIHGHTPIPSLKKRLNDITPWDEKEVYGYNGYKIDIDCYTIKTGKTILLDLNTFDSHVFLSE